MSTLSSHRGGGAGVDVLLVALFLLVGSSMPAQIPDRSGVRTFFEPVDVPLVNVDVHVTDADGRPVADLNLEDFEVLEDGRPVEVSHFAAPSRSTVDDTGHETTPEPTALMGQGLSLVVFFDESDISPRQRRTTIDHLRDFLSGELPATLRLTFVTFSDGRSTVRVPLTDDPSRLVSVLDEIDQGSRPRFVSERDRILRDMQRTAGSLGSTGTNQSFASGPGFDAVTGERPGAQGEAPGERMLKELTDEARLYVNTIRAYSASQRRRTERLLGELERLVGSLSVVPGRKAVLLVCGGLEARPGEGLFLAWEQAFPDMARQMVLTADDEARKNDVGPSIHRLTDSANRHLVSLYTLSDSIRIASGGSAEAAGITGGRDVAQAAQGQDALLAICRATGGISLRSSPGLAEDLGDVVHEMGSFYSLGYVPSHPPDGQAHALSVRVRGRGLDLRHREAYFHGPSADRIAERTLAAAVYGVTENPLDVSIETQEVGAPQSDGGYLVSVLVKVPVARLMLRPEGDRQTGQITALVMVHGPDGLSDPQSWRYPINVTNDQMMGALGSKAGLVLNLAMGEGPQRIAVGVRDDLAGTEAAATLEIDLPPTSPDGAQDE